MENIHPHITTLPTDGGWSLMGEVRDYPWVGETQILLLALVTNSPCASPLPAHATALLPGHWDAPLLPLLQEMLRVRGGGRLPREKLSAIRGL